MYGYPDGYETAIKRAVTLKKTGYITREIMTILRDEGFTNPKTGKPFGRCLVSKWVMGINKQTGKSLRHLGKRELTKHREEMRERQRVLKRKWYRENTEYAKEYGKQYMRETRAYYKSMGLSYDD